MDIFRWIAPKFRSDKKKTIKYISIIKVVEFKKKKKKKTKTLKIIVLTSHIQNFVALCWDKLRSGE